MSTAQRLMTAAEFDRRPNQKAHELIDGRLVKREMSTLATFIGNAIYSLLFEYARRTGNGYAFGDNTNYCCFTDDANRVRKPDASWISKDRAPKGLGHESLTMAPDLIVESVSPRESGYKRNTKVKQFFDAGTQEAWIVHPETNQLERRYADGRAHWYGDDDVIDGAPRLPGFNFKLADILAVMP